MKEKKKERLEIVGLIDKPLWTRIPCKCDKSNIEKQYPLFACLHCKFQTQQNSMPRKPFSISHQELDKNKKPTGTITRVIKKITIVRGDTYQEIRGWVF